ncbi:MAG TPA: NAD(P)-dependent oxidoreductase [Gemmatimonadaceae bacterium]|nr:NAD(P)-dependent oxidoreductase [Gemmatimonadaceae bacterium]
MRIFVTGATGVIGRRAVPLLVGAGHRVTAVGRTPEKRAALERAGATAVELDLFDGAAARRALAGHEVVINLATHMPPSTFHMMLPGAWRENDRVRRVASNVLVDAAIAAGVRRFIQESFGLIYPDSGDRWIDETTPVKPARYNRTTVDAEHAAARFTSGDRAGVVLRFAGFYGPDSTVQKDVIDMVRKGWSPLPGRPEAYYSSISHDDAATAVVAALDVPAGIYGVVDDEPLPRREWVDSLAAALGAPPPRFLPAWTARLMGSIGELMSRSERISNRKLREASGWAPRFRSVKEGWTEVEMVGVGG